MKILCFFSKTYWCYLLETPFNMTKFWCRINNHKCGPIWYNLNGHEPDMRCKNCGDEL